MRDIIRLVVVLTLVCIVAAIALAKVYDFTKEPIAQQRRLARLRAVEAVLPEHDNQPDQDTVELHLDDEATKLVYLGLSQGQVNGFAFEIKNNEGYGGEIVAMLGVNPDGTIYGVEVVRHGETPGLGAKITTPEFISQFRGKSLSNTKFMLQKDGGDLDQVTGATISPRAIVKAIQEGLDFFNHYQQKILKNYQLEDIDHKDGG